MTILWRMKPRLAQEHDLMWVVSDTTGQVNSSLIAAEQAVTADRSARDHCHFGTFRSARGS